MSFATLSPQLNSGEASDNDSWYTADRDPDTCDSDQQSATSDEASELAAEDAAVGMSQTEDEDEYQEQRIWVTCGKLLMCINCTIPHVTHAFRIFKP